MASNVTVVIPTYNRAHLLPQALMSINQQTLVPSQIIVVDDGSTDSTEEVVNKFPSATYIRQENGGKSLALNRSLEHVQGEYVWFFDDDDVAFPDAIERLVGALEDNPKCGYSYGDLQIAFDSEGKLGALGGQSKLPDLVSEAPFVALLEACYLGGARLMARTDCYRKLGGFDPRFRRSQDYEIALRLARHYEGVQVSGGPLYYLRQHAQPRGAGTHEVSVDEVWRRHAQFNELLFRELYHELDLSEYLPAGSEYHQNKRQAVLQRLSVLLIHRVYPEALDELRDFVSSFPRGSLTESEGEVLSRLVRRTGGLALGGFEFSKELALLARSNLMARQLRAELSRRLILYALASTSQPVRLAKILWRCVLQYRVGMRVRQLVRRSV